MTGIASTGIAVVVLRSPTEAAVVSTGIVSTVGSHTTFSVPSGKEVTSGWPVKDGRTLV